MQQLQGIPASPGIAIGPVWVYRPLALHIESRSISDPQAEIERLEDALQTAMEQLKALQRKAAEAIGAEEAAIFEAHQMFLVDPEFIGGIRKTIQEKSINAEAAVDQAVQRQAQQLEALDDEYFQARAGDVRDVGRRVLCALAGIEPLAPGEHPASPAVVLADDLTPSDTVQFNHENLLGMVTVRGGPTSHTAILARSLGVPAAVSVPLPLDEVADETPLILDGGAGTVLLQPDETSLAQAQARESAWRAQRTVELESADHPATTQDGHTVEVVANVGNAQDAEQALKYGAEGVGLFRTEFAFLDRSHMPSESDQIAAYGAAFDVMGGRPFVVRTLDIGGDKNVPYLGLESEPNPFLGWRAIRMIDERPEVLRTQFSALLQAGHESDLRIMLPMVSNLDEIRQARAIFDEARAELEAQGKAQPQEVQLGIMIEVPAAALMAPEFAREVDFFSIGTNDLTQYTLAVDRTNERVAPIASPFHPAVLRLIQTTIEAAHSDGKWVGLCGEMAGDPLATALLLGLGLDEFSAAPASIPSVKRLIRLCDMPACQTLAAEALALATTEEVVAHLEAFQKGLGA